jgi:hypothetical protein
MNPEVRLLLTAVPGTSPGADRVLVQPGLPAVRPVRLGRVATAV